MLDKLKSRKFWLTFGVAVVVVFSGKLGLELTEDQVWQLVATVGAYVGAEGLVDAKRIASAK